MSTAFRNRVRIRNAASGGLWWRLPIALTIWAVLAAPIVAAGIALATLREYAEGLPRIPDLEAWENSAPRTTVILAADGSRLAEIPFQVGPKVGHRHPVAYADIPERMVQALLAAEDVRFFRHHGVDPRAVARAAWANYRAGRVVEGASTITQQVARNLLPEIGHQRTLRRKVREALLARRIERSYSKTRILEVYANHVFLGANAYGIAAAARAYFSEDLDDLDLGEAALIAGLAQAPGRADPFQNRDAARARRDEVLERMWRAEFVDQAAYRRAAARPIELRPATPSYGTLAPWYTERVRRSLEEHLPAAYQHGGLRVETAARPALAISAEERARSWTERLARGQDFGPPQVGALVWDHRTGYVEATTGGRSWGEDRFDRATQACRQPGSAFKPLLYAAAIERDAITPGTPLRDAPIAEYDADDDVFWKPDNSGRDFRGVALAHDALVASLNAPAVDVLDRVGAKSVADLARRLGIETELTDARPLALGASCVVPLQLAGAYATLARNGRAATPIFAVRASRGDRILFDHAHPHDPRLHPARRLDRMAALAGDAPDRAMDERSAYLVSSMLRDVVRRGTATDARALARPAAGKTGTTNDNTDAWFVGYTARVVAAVWIGHDDPSQSLGSRHSGSRAALPLWMKLVRLAEGARAPRDILDARPDGLERALVDRETGLLARPGAGGAVELWFKEGTAPTRQVGAVPGVPTDLGRTSQEF